MAGLACLPEMFRMQVTAVATPTEMLSVRSCSSITATSPLLLRGGMRRGGAARPRHPGLESSETRSTGNEEHGRRVGRERGAGAAEGGWSASERCVERWLQRRARRTLVRAAATTDWR